MRADERGRPFEIFNEFSTNYDRAETDLFQRRGNNGPPTWNVFFSVAKLIHEEGTTQ